MAVPSNPPNAWWEQAWREGLQAKLVRLDSYLGLLRTEIELQEPAPAVATPTLRSNPLSLKVFVVHGHDNEMKEAVARTLTKLGLQPIILHEQPNCGRTVVEKFIDYSDVDFAVVLLSPDDMAYPKDSDLKKARPRARQNVILELGFFVGKLGRGHVLPLHKVVPDFEMPSDYHGVLFKPFDDNGSWQLELVKELKACGYNISADKLIE